MMTEAQIQTAFVQWWRLAHRGLGVPDARLLIMIPNGAYLGAGTMQTARGSVSLAAIRFGKLKRQGFVQGAPDLFLAVPRGSLHGLFLELKRDKGGRTAPAQEEMLELLLNQRYGARVCCGLDDAIDCMTRYLTDL